MSKGFNSQSYQLMKTVMAGDEAAFDAVLATHPELDWQDSEDKTTMHIAAQLGRVSMIRKLAAAGAKLDIIDKSQRTPLALAAEEGQLDAAKALVDAGAGPQVEADKYAITLAADKKRYDVMRFLLSKHFPVDYMPPATGSPLMKASLNDDVEMIKILLAAGADKDLRNYMNSTALHYAAGSNKHEAARYLIGEGANTEITDIHGMTPGRIADEQNYIGMSALLSEAKEVFAEAQKRRDQAAKEAHQAMLRERTEMLNAFSQGSNDDITSPAAATFKRRSHLKV